MKGYFARVTGCSGTTSVDFGSYSSIDMVCEPREVQNRSARREILMNREDAILARGRGKSIHQPKEKLPCFVKRGCRDALILAVRADVVVIVGNARNAVRRNSRSSQVRAVGGPCGYDRHYRNPRPYRGRGGL